jgi:hypothetical protein
MSTDRWATAFERLSRQDGTKRRLENFLRLFAIFSAP